MNFIWVYTTAGSKEEAEKIAMHLLEAKLVTCVNYFPIKARYLWKDKIEKTEECILICKTIDSKFEEVKNEIEKIHSYEMPYIAKIKLEELNKKCADWSLNYMGW